MTHAHRSEASLRELLMVWSMWLLGSWGIALSIYSASLPAVRLMMMSACLGLMVIWPLWRLSQHHGDGEIPPTSSNEGDGVRGQEAAGASVMSPWAVLMDWFAMVVILQAVIWLLSLSVHWGWRQTLSLDLAIMAWSLLIGSVVAIGCRSNRGLHRSLAMACCLLLLLAEPALVSLWQTSWPVGSGPSWDMRVSPIETVWALTGEPENWTLEPWMDRVRFAGLAAGAAWLLLLGWHGLSRRKTAAN